MKSQQVEKPEQARKRNGGGLLELGREYALIGRAQSRCPCATCTKAAADSHYFAQALAIVGMAAIEDRAAQLYEVLRAWAQENLEDCPPALPGSLYQEREADFPEIIGEEH